MDTTAQSQLSGCRLISWPPTVMYQFNASCSHAQCTWASITKLCYLPINGDDLWQES